MTTPPAPHPQALVQTCEIDGSTECDIQFSDAGDGMIERLVLTIESDGSAVIRASVDDIHGGADSFRDSMYLSAGIFAELRRVLLGLHAVGEVAPNAPALPQYRFNNLGQMAALFDSYAKQGRADKKPERADAFAQAADIVRRTTLMEPQP